MRLPSISWFYVLNNEHTERKAVFHKMPCTSLQCPVIGKVKTESQKEKIGLGTE